MPGVRAVNHQLPLRSPQAPYRDSPCLIANHKTYHPEEARIYSTVKTLENNITIAGYDFFGRFVEVARVHNPRIDGFLGSLYRLKPMTIGEIAGLVLEQTFGRAETEEEVFTTEWGMLENRNPGYVFWDTENDRTIVTTKEGLTLSMRGTNLVEAAVYLPRMYEQALKLRSEVKEGIQRVNLEISGPQAEWSQAASPLVIQCHLPDLSALKVEEIDHRITGTLTRAIANRI
jgi:hypothetical protein